MFQQDVTTGTFRVPSDWTVVITYQLATLFFYGNIKLSSWVEQYTKDDVEFIKDH
jgi:hypothetical protein